MEVTREISGRGGGVEGSATSSFGEYEFNELSSVEMELIVVGPGVDNGRLRQCGSGDWKRV